MYQEFHGVEIKAIAAAVPKKTISNDHFQAMLSAKEIRMFEKTVGILERRWAEAGVTASDLAYQAARNLFNDYPDDKQDIDCLIFLSQTPDYKIPFTSNILQDRLGLKQNMLCLDINAGCAGFVQGLATAFSISQTLTRGKVLFVVAETMSKILSDNDRGTTMLFGDGAAAILIENTKDNNKQAFFNFFTDGSNADAIIIPDGGYRNGITAESFETTQDENLSVRNRLNLAMDGPRVFDFTLREITPSIQELLDISNVDKESVDYFLMHQSNQFIIRQIASQLGVSAEKMLLNIQSYGNTSGVSIPLLMSSHNKILQTAKTVLLSGYGVGLNWANCILKNMDYKCLEITEI